MRVLLVTGRLAEDMVKTFSWNADVLALDVDVASFITPQMLREAEPYGYDLILIPGAITANFSPLESELKAKIRLGPKHAADLKYVLRHLEEIELSTKIPACILLSEKMRENALSMVNKLEEKSESSLTINGVKIGHQSRMKVLAEIVDSTLLCELDLINKINYCESQGADMIDLGIPLDAEPAQVENTVKVAKKATSLPVSVDTMKPELILAGIKAGVDLVLSVDGENLVKVGKELARAKVPAVVVPGPKTGLEENIVKAQSSGIKVMADPILNPPLLGLVPSANKYLKFHQKHPEIPLFFGAGNVTELIDVDSPGVNGLMAAMGTEVGASILFTPEYSDKSKGSIKELRTASEMMILAKNRKAPPKDLGIDLLILKEKRRHPEEKFPENFLVAKDDHKWAMDPAGSFKINISEDKIVANHGEVTVVGESAIEVLNTIIDRGLVTRLDHAGYLGRELQRAELAIKLGRSYNQDETF